MGYVKYIDVWGWLAVSTEAEKYARRTRNLERPVARRRPHASPRSFVAPRSATSICANGTRTSLYRDAIYRLLDFFFLQKKKRKKIVHYFSRRLIRRTHV